MLKDLLVNQLAPGEVDRTGERVDGKATIIGKLGYNWIAVLDAAYRQKKPLYYGSKNAINLRKHAVASPNTAPAYGSLTSAAEILSTDPIDPLTSGQGTYADGLNSVLWYASAYCSSIAIAGTTAAFPNIQTLAFIYLRKAFIDSLDPTLSANPTKSLVNYWGMGSGYAGSGTPRAGVPNLYVISTAGMLASLESGSSLYPAVYPILEIPAYEDRTGERIDNKATIIGKLGDNWIAVLDAAYRANAKRFSLNNAYDISAGIPATSGSLVVTSSSTENTIITELLYDIHNSKWNTDYLNQVQTAATFPAAKMCYDITIDGKHAQLPNVQALAFVYSKKDYVDANDPTASSNTAKKLSNWGFGNTWVCSSTAGDSSSRVVALNLNGIATAQNNRTDYYGVIPILEIPLYKDRTGERIDDKATIAGKLGNYWIAVLDAAHRSASTMWGGGSEVQNSYTVGSNTTFTSAAFESVFLNDVQLRNTESSAYLTNGLANYPSRPARDFCVGKTLLGRPCVLPNIQVMSYLRSNGLLLDSMDPTVAENQSTALFQSSWYTWTSSSSTLNADTAYATSGDKVVSLPRENSRGVVPVLEIPLWCDDDYK